MEQNNIIGEWIKWEPIEGLAKKYLLEDVTSNINGLKIKLLDHNNQNSGVSIFFKDSVWAYRMVDEGFMLLTTNQLYNRYNTSFYTEWCFFKVKNSDYLNWMALQSFNMSNNLNLQHFSILLLDDYIDIIAGYEPEVALFTEK